MKYSRIVILILIIVVLAIGGFIYLQRNNSEELAQVQEAIKQLPDKIVPEPPLSIEYMRKQEYPGSDLVIEQTLSSGSSYKRYVVSYLSEGLKIYALLTVPNGTAPEGGWPVIVFNHGYIPPAQYRTTERYIAYTDAFSRNGYVLIRPDYRGHGSSEGQPEGAYYSPAYTIDVLNAVSSIKKYPSVNPDKIGMWGHSMGGMVTLRSMVTTKDVKVGVIWAGVVASYYDLANNWRRTTPFSPSPREQTASRPNRQRLIDENGTFEANPKFWDSITPIAHVEDVSGPIQLHHGTADAEVPLLFSERLRDAMQEAGKTVELYSYEGDDHNISRNLGTALDRSVKFFDKYLK